MKNLNPSQIQMVVQIAKHLRNRSALLSKKERKLRSAVPRGGNDCVDTPDYLARLIVQHFRPSGERLEPCCGGCAFVRAMSGCDQCEIREGTDFFDVCGHYDWILTNPPYSQFRAFLHHAMRIADNIVFLGRYNAWGTRSWQRDLRKAGFGIVEHCEVTHLPPPPWPQFGMLLVATWARRGWKGSTHFSILDEQTGNLPRVPARLTQETADEKSLRRGQKQSGEEPAA